MAQDIIIHCRPTGVRGGLSAKRCPGLPGAVLHAVCLHGGGAEGVGAHLVLAAAPPKSNEGRNRYGTAIGRKAGAPPLLSCWPSATAGAASASLVLTLRFAPGSPRRFGAPAYPHRVYRPAGDPIGSPPRCGAPVAAQAPPTKENRPSFDSRQDSLVSGV